MTELEDVFTKDEIQTLKACEPDEVPVVRNNSLVLMKKDAREASFREATRRACEILRARLGQCWGEVDRHDQDFRPWDNWLTVTFHMKDGRQESVTVLLQDVSNH